VAIIERFAPGDKRANQRTRRHGQRIGLGLPVAAAIRPEKTQTSAFQC
jgi:hypothetical protein